jgi:glycerophosphoryl diester phosphodiesterase
VTDAGGRPPEPHPDSLLIRRGGPPVWLKVHRCVWSGRHAPNSLDAVRECHRARVARAEVDLWLLRDRDGVIDHDGLIELPGHRLVSAAEVGRDDLLAVPAAGRPPLLSELVELVRGERYPTVIEIDLKDEVPWTRERVDEIVGRVSPIRERVTLAGCQDETLRRLAAAEASLSVGFNPQYHLDWLPRDRAEELAGPADADGWFDRTGGRTPGERLRALRALVQTAGELHLRLEAFERLLLETDGDAAELLHDDGWAIDIWTLDAGMVGWRTRLAAAVAAGVDMITTTTAPVLAAAARDLPPR